MNKKFIANACETVAAFIAIGLASVYIGLAVTVWIFSITGCEVKTAAIWAAPVCIVVGYFAYKNLMFHNMSIVRLLRRIDASRMRRVRRRDAERVYERYKRIKAMRGSSHCVPYFEEHFGEPVQRGEPT